MERFVEFLFKYRPVVFEKGSLVFATAGVARIAVLLLGVISLAAVFTYVRLRIRGTPRDRIVLSTIRTLIVILVVFALLRPVLQLSVAPPRTNVVGVLIDDSRSMQLADVEGQTRASIIRKLLGGPDSTLYKALQEGFVVRLFRTSGGGDRLEQVEELNFDGTRTKLAPALEGVRHGLAGTAVSGIVLVSDGGDNALTGLGETLHTLNARRVPVYTIGVGQERFEKDIEITRVTAPASVLKGSSVDIQVDIVHRGFSGKTVQLRAEEDGSVLNTVQVELPRDGEAKTARIRVPAATAGAHSFTVGVAPQAGELVAENNKRTILVMVRDSREKILYVEGEPRFEFKFLRNALQSDENIQLAAMVRVMKDRFFRFGIDHPLELANGFPKTREELFKYSGIVIGSIEANFFSLDQMRMISDFVSERGGGLVMLGGKRAFAEGGYAGTPIADVLPVELSDGQYGKPVFQQVKVDVTSAGAMMPATQIAATEGESKTRWKTMPSVTSVNQLPRTKPGAVTLLSGAVTNRGGRTVVMAYQRYGRGKSIAFPVQDSWLWQMRSDTPVNDPTYATFWRQLLRWVTSEARGRVTTTVPSEPVDVGEPISIAAEVTDSIYTRVNTARVVATIKAPSGESHQVPMEWSGTRDGEYRAVFTPTERGVHRIEVEAQIHSETVTSEPTVVNADASAIEYFGAEQRSALLRRISEETGGRYYTPKTVDGLAKDLVYSEAGTTTFQRLDLWDIPVLFLLLVVLLCSEWGYRRARGLV